MLPRLSILASALLFSTGGAAIKASLFTSWQVAGVRSGIAALALALVLPSARRRWTRPTWLVGGAYAATVILFVSATKLTTAANAIFLQAAAPLYVILLGRWLLNESIRRRDLPFMAAVAFGIALFLAGEQRPLVTAPDPGTGNLLAVLCGLTWAVTIIGLRWLGRGPGETAGSTLAAVTAGNVITFAVCLPPSLPLPDAGPIQWALLVYLGVFQLGLAYLLLTAGVRHVPAFEVSFLLLLELALNPFWTWLAHGEQPGRLALLGAVAIMAGTAAKAWTELPRRPARAAAEPVAPIE